MLRGIRPGRDRETVQRKGCELMAVLRILSNQGDTKYEWDIARVQQGDVDAVAAIREAERIFAQQRARGATAFKVWPGRSAERLDSFDPQAENVVIVPRVAGG